jgi:hypothetical protein
LLENDQSCILVSLSLQSIQTNTHQSLQKFIPIDQSGAPIIWTIYKLSYLARVKNAFGFQHGRLFSSLDQTAPGAMVFPPNWCYISKTERFYQSDYQAS